MLTLRYDLRTRHPLFAGRGFSVWEVTPRGWVCRDPDLRNAERYPVPATDFARGVLRSDLDIVPQACYSLTLRVPVGRGSTLKSRRLNTMVDGVPHRPLAQLVNAEYSLYCRRATYNSYLEHLRPHGLLDPLEDPCR